ncbi:MAG: hypothetical protein M3P85_07615 [Actinomycetota bacterium]|nr:hypothetical protein [Actinomycetota bacterium]
MSPEDLVQEARAAAVAVGVAGARPSDPDAASDYLGRVRDVAEGLMASAANDTTLLHEAMALSLAHDAAQGPGRYMSGATRALGLAAVWAIPADDAALQAAVVAEGQTAGSSEGLAARRIRAIADLTRWDPDVLAQAVRLVPTGIVRLCDVPDGAAIAREILLTAREALEGMRAGPENS